MSRQISVIVPLHNEAANLRPLHNALDKAIKKLPYSFELIFIDDGSTDESLAVLEAIASRDRRLRIVEFARNFGKEAAVSAGLHVARGDAVIMMDADLQHPPAEIPKFIGKWTQGADLVVGVRKYDRKESVFKRATSWLFYKLMGIFGVREIVPRASDFRLIDRKVVNAFKALTERNRMTRSLIDWLGFRRAFVNFEARQRLSGTARYGLRKLVSLAINSFTANSLFPLKFAGYLGLAILVAAGLLGVFMYINTYVIHDPYNLRFTGTAMLATLIVFLVGLVLACLGLIAMYIARIHAEVSNRPLYVVRRDSSSQNVEMEGEI